MRRGKRAAAFRDDDDNFSFHDDEDEAFLDGREGTEASDGASSRDSRVLRPRPRRAATPWGARRVAPGPDEETNMRQCSNSVCKSTGTSRWYNSPLLPGSRVCCACCCYERRNTKRRPSRLGNRVRANPSRVTECGNVECRAEKTSYSTGRISGVPLCIRCYSREYSRLKHQLVPKSPSPRKRRAPPRASPTSESVRHRPSPPPHVEPRRRSSRQRKPLAPATAHDTTPVQHPHPRRNNIARPMNAHASSSRHTLDFVGSPATTPPPYLAPHDHHRNNRDAPRVNAYTSSSRLTLDHSPIRSTAPSPSRAASPTPVAESEGSEDELDCI